MKKAMRLAVVVLLGAMLLASFSHARSVPELLSGGLAEINNFFEGENYRPYAKAIDFFFFAMLFIAIYLMGAKYAFKEMKNPEKAIVVLLGLMTAFLLVLGDFSATMLIPWIHWLLYLLLFFFYWWLYKGIKNNFWRFLLALLSTILTIMLMQGLLNWVTPDVPNVNVPGVPSIGGGGFFKDFFGGFKSIKLPGVSMPGVPNYAKDWFGASSTTPSTETGTITQVPTPSGPVVPDGTPAPKTDSDSGWSGLWWLAPLLLILPFLGRLRNRKEGSQGESGATWWQRLKEGFRTGFRRGRGERETEDTLESVINEIKESIEKKREAFLKTRKIMSQKQELEKKYEDDFLILDLYHKKIDDDAFYLDPEHESHQKLLTEHEEVGNLLKNELELEKILVELMKLEDELLGVGQLPLRSLRREKFTGKSVGHTSSNRYGSLISYKGQKEWYGKLFMWEEKIGESTHNIDPRISEPFLNKVYEVFDKLGDKNKGIVKNVRKQIIKYYFWTIGESKITSLLRNITESKALEKFFKARQMPKWHAIRKKKHDEIRQLFERERKEIFIGTDKEPGLLKSIYEQYKQLLYLLRILEQMREVKKSVTELQPLFVSRQTDNKWEDVTSIATKEPGVNLGPVYKIHARIKEGIGPFEVGCYVNGKPVTVSIDDPRAAHLRERKLRPSAITGESVLVGNQVLFTKLVNLKHDEALFTFEEMGIIYGGEYEVKFVCISKAEKVYGRRDIKKIKIYVQGESPNQILRIDNTEPGKYHYPANPGTVDFETLKFDSGQSSYLLFDPDEKSPTFRKYVAVGPGHKIRIIDSKIAAQGGFFFYRIRAKTGKILGQSRTFAVSTRAPGARTYRNSFEFTFNNIGLYFLELYTSELDSLQNEQPEDLAVIEVVKYMERDAIAAPQVTAAAPPIPPSMLVLTPKNGIPSQPIELLSDYHKGNSSFKIGKGIDRNSAVPEFNSLHLADTMIFPIAPEPNKNQVSIIYDNIWKIRKHFDSTVLKIDGSDLQEVALPGGFFRLQINEYEFDAEISNIMYPLPSPESYNAKFPVELRLIHDRPSFQTLSVLKTAIKLTPLNSTRKEPILIIPRPRYSSGGIFIGKGWGPTNEIRLVDTAIFSEDEKGVALPQFIFNTRAPDKFLIGKIGIGTLIIDGKDVTPKEGPIGYGAKYVELKDFQRVQINEYQFDVELIEAKNIPTPDEYKSSFPVELHLEKTSMINTELMISPKSANTTGVEYGAKIGVLGKVIRGKATNAYLFIRRVVNGMPEDDYVYPASKTMEEFKMIVYKSGKTISKAGKKVLFTSNDFGDLAPGEYQVEMDFYNGREEVDGKVGRIRINPKRKLLGEGSIESLSAIELVPINSHEERTNSKKPIVIPGEYIKGFRNALHIGNDESNDVVLVNSPNDEDMGDRKAPQAMVQFMNNRFILIKTRKPEVLINGKAPVIHEMDASGVFGFFPLTPSAQKITINEYEFSVRMIHTTISHMEFERQFAEPGLRLLIDNIERKKIGGKWAAAAALASKTNEGSSLARTELPSIKSPNLTFRSQFKDNYIEGIGKRDFSYIYDLLRAPEFREYFLGDETSLFEDLTKAVEEGREDDVRVLANTNTFHDLFSRSYDSEFFVEASQGVTKYHRRAEDEEGRQLHD